MKKALLLVVAGLMACTPRLEMKSHHVLPALLPPIPTEVHSALGPVEVIWVDSLKSGDGRFIFGGYHPWMRHIYLSKFIQNEVVAWHTLLHERCHVWMWDSGLAVLIDPKLADTVCDLSATEQVAAMLDRHKQRTAK